MAFIVEDGTGLTNSTSYASIAEADSYFDNFNNTTWSALDDANKQLALNKGTAFIDEQYLFKGSKTDYENALEFPRYETGVVGYDGESVPVAIKKATYESALKSLTSELQPDVDSRAVTKEKVDVIEVEYSDNEKVEQTNYTKIDNILKASGFLASKQGTAGGTLRVVRV